MAPNPLQILAGLAQVGASGAGGAYQGAVEAPFAKQQLQTGEIENQLRLLRGLALQQSLGPQYTVDNQGRILLQAPGQPPRMTGELPMGQAGQARMDFLQSQTERAQAQAALAEAKGLRAGQGPQLPAAQAKAYEEWQTRPQNQGKGYLDFLKDYTAATHPEAKPTQQLELSVRTKLMGMGIDPATATPDQIQQASAAVDADRLKRAEAVGGVHEKQAERKEERKTEAALGPMTVAIDQMKSVIDQIDKEGFLPKELPPNLTGIPRALAAAKELARARSVQLAYGQFSPAWQKWITNQGVLIGIDRSVFNDIGRGGQMMYSAVKNFSEHPPTAPAMRDVFAQWDQSIAARRGGGGAKGTGGGTALPPGAEQGRSQAPGFPPLPPPETEAGNTVTWDPTGEKFKSDGTKWDRVGGAQGQPAGRTAPGAAPSGGKRPAIGPNGETGFLPRGTDLSKYPGYRWAQ